MKKGTVLCGIVEKLDFPNKGRVKTGEGMVLVKNVLPGQKIELSITKTRNSRYEGRLVKVISDSPLESRNSFCPQFGQCGGCSYQRISYEAQLSIKERQVRELMKQVIPEEEMYYEGILGSPVEWAYRNKMEYSFGDEFKGGPLSLGMHKRGSYYDVLTVDKCCLVHEDYNKILKYTLDFFKKKNIRYYHKMERQGFLRHLLIRRVLAGSTGKPEILISLITASGGKPENKDVGNEYGEKVDERASERESENTSENTGKILSENAADFLWLKEWMQGLFKLGLEAEIAGILHILNDSLADVVKCDYMNILYGKDYLEERLFGLKFKISVFSFFQTNTLAAEVLYGVVREYVEGEKSGFPDNADSEKNRADFRKNGVYFGENEPDSGENVMDYEKNETDYGKNEADYDMEEKKKPVIYDLYCGTGTISQILAPVANKVIGVEIVEEAVEAARENAERNGLSNCEFIAGDVLKVLDTVETKPDIIVLDPPRDGVNPKALKKIIGYQVERIVYVSCKPTSLRRDMEVFLENGYKPERYRIIDQFPGTGHVETIVGLQRRDM